MKTTDTKIIIMKQPPVLKTERLILSLPTLVDVPKIVEYAGNEKIAATTQNLPHPYQEKDAIFWLNMANQGFQNQDKHIFGLHLKSTKEFIGGMGLHVNQAYERAVLGYWVAFPFWNKGYATEALAAVLKFGFEVVQLNKIYAVHLVENPASGKVMIKNGMIKEGELKEHTKKGDQYRSVIQYRLTRKEYSEL